MNLARLGNKYLADMEPWKLQKTDPERVKTIMYVALQITGGLSVLLEPFLPNTASTLRGFLSVSACKWEDAVSGTLVAEGRTINPPSILFEKIDDEFVKKEQELLFATKESTIAVEVEPQKPLVEFDDFSKMDIRVGKIVSAEKVKKADKLLQLVVDTGVDQRTIISGIAEHYSPEEVVGKQVSVLLNLAPRKIRGVESQGMILMAENSEGKLCFVSPENDFETGSNIR